MLDIAARITKLMELKHKGRRPSNEQPNFTWPSNLANKIIEGMKTAEREVLKTMEEMEMIPALRAANAVYQNDRTGEITAMNTASSAFVEDKSLTPDENNVATFEELFHLDNDILLGSLQEENTVRLEGIADVILNSQRPEQESEEELDEGDPENCQLYKIGTCKFLQQGFVEPAKGRNLERNQEMSNTPGNTRQHIETNKAQYIEYNGQVYHIANFLSLQIGKAYVTSSGRLSRWLSTSRCNFYDSIASYLNVGEKTVFSLGSFIALFVPDIHLVVGRVTRITRTLKASTSFPLLHVDKDSSKLPGFIEVAILLFRGVGEESGDLPTVYTETSKYMWCNSRECILALHGEAHDKKFIMTKDDHALISEKLPVLKAKDSRRAKLEEKEKQEKIKQLKAGDPKDMTVILLREVLLEMGIPFKSIKAQFRRRTSHEPNRIR
ncbi:hypothetical protein OS493_014911 [Desmophyllum pertusum]|uniref:Uncharacterized protein n=1 Tax=Desmophyllum pertusum TaxID=174260 RepID=A0A9X0A241_9CNID|nr:hypothetical protein OS493_014911 [Desmophyllum pertusum]